MSADDRAAFGSRSVRASFSSTNGCLPQPSSTTVSGFQAAPQKHGLTIRSSFFDNMAHGIRDLDDANHGAIHLDARFASQGAHGCGDVYASFQIFYYWASPLTKNSRAIVPIGIMFSISLICGNLAYLYLSVSFIQMLKVFTPYCIPAVYRQAKLTLDRPPTWSRLYLPPGDSAWLNQT